MNTSKSKEKEERTYAERQLETEKNKLDTLVKEEKKEKNENDKRKKNNQISQVRLSIAHWEKDIRLAKEKSSEKSFHKSHLEDELEERKKRINDLKKQITQKGDANGNLTIALGAAERDVEFFTNKLQKLYPTNKAGAEEPQVGNSNSLHPITGSGKTEGFLTRATELAHSSYVTYKKKELERIEKEISKMENKITTTRESLLKSMSLEEQDGNDSIRGNSNIDISLMSRIFQETKNRVISEDEDPKIQFKQLKEKLNALKGLQDILMEIETEVNKKNEKKYRK